MSLYRNEKSGIYKISFPGANDVYIGSSKQLRRRKSVHFQKLSRGSHPNYKLQTFFNKYHHVKFEILEYCNLSELREKEQFYIDCYKSELNLCNHASERSIGFKRKRYDC